jgi:hypothetical protein
MEEISCKLKHEEYKLVRETKLKSTVWQTFGYIFDGDEKLKDVVGCFMCKKSVFLHRTQIRNFKNLIKHNVKVAKRTLPVSSQLKKRLNNQEFLQI